MNNFLTPFFFIFLIKFPFQTPKKQKQNPKTKNKKKTLKTIYILSAHFKNPCSIKAKIFMVIFFYMHYNSFFLMSCHWLDPVIIKGPIFVLFICSHFRIFQLIIQKVGKVEKKRFEFFFFLFSSFFKLYSPYPFWVLFQNLILIPFFGFPREGINSGFCLVFWVLIPSYTFSFLRENWIELVPNVIRFERLKIEFGRVLGCVGGGCFGYGY